MLTLWLQAGIMICGLTVGTNVEKCTYCFGPAALESKMARVEKVQEGKMHQFTTKECKKQHRVPASPHK